MNIFLRKKEKFISVNYKNQVFLGEELKENTQIDLHKVYFGKVIRKNKVFYKLIKFSEEKRNEIIFERDGKKIYLTPFDFSENSVHNLSKKFNQNNFNYWIIPSFRNSEEFSKAKNFIVAVKYKKQIAVSFHPELNNDSRVYEYFYEMIE